MLAKSGHRTVRVAFKVRTGLASPHGKKLLAWLRRHRIAFERFEPRMIGIDLATQRAYDKLVTYLDAIPKSAKMIGEDGDPQPKHGVGGADVERRRQIKSTRKRAPRTT